MSENKNSATPAQGATVARKESKLQRIIASLPAEVRMDAAKAVEFKQILQTQPPKSWVKKHPKGYHYLPFDKIMTMINVLYKKHEVSIVSYSQVINSIVVHCRVKLTAFDGTTTTVDGIGAAPIHTAKGASPMAHDKVIVDAVQLAAPAAYTYAIKNALRKVGRIFGSDLEVEDPADFASIGINAEMIKNIKI